MTLELILSSNGHAVTVDRTSRRRDRLSPAPPGPGPAAASLAAAPRRDVAGIRKLKDSCNQSCIYPVLIFTPCIKLDLFVFSVVLAQCCGHLKAFTRILPGRKASIMAESTLTFLQVHPSNCRENLIQVIKTLDRALERNDSDSLRKLAEIFDVEDTPGLHCSRASQSKKGNLGYGNAIAKFMGNPRFRERQYIQVIVMAA